MLRERENEAKRHKVILYNLCLYYHIYDYIKINANNSTSSSMHISFSTQLYLTLISSFT